MIPVFIGIKFFTLTPTLSPQREKGPNRLLPILREG
jgi:hypothetical protein